MVKFTPAMIDLRAANLLRLFPVVDEFTAKNPHFKREHNEYSARLQPLEAFGLIDVADNEDVQLVMI